MNNVEEKKEYVAPQMTVVEMACSTFLCSSSEGGDTEILDDVVGD